MSEFTIGNVKELTEFPNSEEAKKLLTKLVAATAKVLVRRKWSVGILREFYPSNAHLLGLNENGGQTIRVRLRSARDKNVFLPWEDVLGTMVHELTHNSVSSHSAEFYSLMDKVYDEVEADERGGTFGGPLNNTSIPYSFESSKGVKLGGGGWGGVLSTGARKNQAAEAAIRRQLINGGGTSGVVGGSAVAPKTADELRQLRLRSIERRQADQSSCSIGRQNASPSSIADVPSSSSSRYNSGSTSSSGKNSTSKSSLVTVTDDLQSYFTFWMCSICLEQNVSLDSNCVFCGQSRSSSDAECRLCSTGSVCGCCAGGRMTTLGKRISEIDSNSTSSSRNGNSSSSSGKIARVYDLTEGSPPARSSGSAGKSSRSADDGSWQCSRCTFVNIPDTSSVPLALSPVLAVDGVKSTIRVCQMCQEIEEHVENVY